MGRSTNEFGMGGQYLAWVEESVMLGNKQVVATVMARKGMQKLTLAIATL